MLLHDAFLPQVTTSLVLSVSTSRSRKGVSVTLQLPVRVGGSWASLPPRSGSAWLELVNNTGHQPECILIVRLQDEIIRPSLLLLLEGLHVDKFVFVTKQNLD